MTSLAEPRLFALKNSLSCSNQYLLHNLAWIVLWSRGNRTACCTYTASNAFLNDLAAWHRCEFLDEAWWRSESGSNHLCSPIDSGPVPERRIRKADDSLFVGHLARFSRFSRSDDLKFFRLTVLVNIPVFYTISLYASLFQIAHHSSNVWAIRSIILSFM